MNTGDKIKKLRLERNMTLEELGNRVGVGKSTIRKWETGFISNMRRDKIALVAEALGVSPLYFIDESAEPDIEENDIWELRERLRRQPGMRVLFNATKDATEEDLENVVEMIKILKKRSKK